MEVDRGVRTGPRVFRARVEHSAAQQILDAPTVQGRERGAQQLARTEGLVGFSLLARPARKQYATLSVWLDEAALVAFADASPHRELRADLAPEMGPTKFVQWTIKGSAGRPSWRDAMHRLG